MSEADADSDGFAATELTTDDEATAEDQQTGQQAMHADSQPAAVIDADAVAEEPANEEADEPAEPSNEPANDEPAPDDAEESDANLRPPCRCYTTNMEVLELVVNKEFLPFFTPVATWFKMETHEYDKSYLSTVRDKFLECLKALPLFGTIMDGIQPDPEKITIQTVNKFTASMAEAFLEGSAWVRDAK